MPDPRPTQQAVEHVTLADYQAEVEKREEVEGQRDAEVDARVEAQGQAAAAESKLSSVAKELERLQREWVGAARAGAAPGSLAAVKAQERADALADVLRLLRDKGTEQGGVDDASTTLAVPLLDDGAGVSKEGDPGLKEESLHCPKCFSRACRHGLPLVTQKRFAELHPPVDSTQQSTTGKEDCER